MSTSLIERVTAQIAHFDAALVAADYASLRAWVADDFNLIIPTGAQLSKKGWLSWLTTRVRYHRIERTFLRTSQLGPVVLVCSRVASLMTVRGVLGDAPAPHHTIRTELWSAQDETLLLETAHLTQAATATA